MDFLQADNELRTFAKETGGAAYFPRFQGEYNQIFQMLHQALRNQYVITYQPSNTKHDGAFRKIKVELVNPATNEPLPMKDEKGKPIKYQIVAKSGYKAPRAGRIAPAARLGITRSRECQEMNLATFQRDANPLTLALRLCYAPTRSAHENTLLSDLRASSSSMTIATDCWSAAPCWKKSGALYKLPSAARMGSSSSRPKSSIWW